VIDIWTLLKYMAGGAGNYHKRRVTEKFPAVREVLSLVYKLGR